jgi:hypothetical protein
MRIVVDNSAGADVGFADEVARGLRALEHDVEVRPADPRAKFDTSVHLLSAGLALRVDERPDRAALARIEDVVRAALLHRTSQRRRTRAVAVHVGESARVIDWIDVFG